MKRVIPIVIGIGILAAFAWTLIFLYQKSQAKAVVFDTAKPFMSDVVKKTVATGAIVPRQEIEIKPRVSGVIDALEVEPGEIVKKGQVLARIKLIPDVVTLNAAQSRINSARISFQNARRERDRYKKLLTQAAISDTEFRGYQLSFRLKQQELTAAVNNLQLLKKGAARGSSNVSNVVTSTVDGMVLAVPVKVGASVIQSNNFNAGTTIAIVANMKDMLFQGLVDESEVGKIKVGMALDIRIGAVESMRFPGTLEYIAPKGVEKEGAIQFEIKAAVKLKENIFIRAGYSANADIVLDRRDKVMVINEGLLQFDKGKPYVEVEVGEQQFERRDVKVGLSDGIKIEILSGIDKDTKIKKQKR